MLRKHYLNHAAEVIRMAPMLRQKHFEWAKWDFIPVCERYHRTRNALAYRGAANEALRSEIERLRQERAAAEARGLERERRGDEVRG